MYRISFVYFGKSYDEDFNFLENAINYYTFKNNDSDNMDVQLKKNINGEWIVI